MIPASSIRAAAPAALALLLAACGGSGEADETAAADNVEALAEAAVAGEGLVREGVAESVAPEMDEPVAEPAEGSQSAAGKSEGEEAPSGETGESEEAAAEPSGEE